MLELFSLKNRVILVTGASRGLGLGMARCMAQAGGHVIINGRHAASLEEVAGTLRGEGLSVDIAPYDVGDETAASLRWCGGTAGLTCWSAMPGSSIACRSTSSPPPTGSACSIST
jgi:hypothetical protein